MQQYLSQRQQKLKKSQRRTNNPEKIISEQLNDKKGAVKKAPCKKRRINDFLIVKDPSFVLKLTCNEKFNTKVF